MQVAKTVKQPSIHLFKKKKQTQKTPKAIFRNERRNRFDHGGSIPASPWMARKSLDFHTYRLQPFIVNM